MLQQIGIARFEPPFAHNFDAGRMTARPSATETTDETEQ